MSDSSKWKPLPKIWQQVSFWCYFCNYFFPLLSSISESVIRAIFPDYFRTAIYVILDLSHIDEYSIRNPSKIVHFSMTNCVKYTHASTHPQLEFRLLLLNEAFTYVHYVRKYVRNFVVLDAINEKWELNKTQRVDLFRET